MGLWSEITAVAIQSVDVTVIPYDASGPLLPRPCGVQKYGTGTVDGTGLHPGQKIVAQTLEFVKEVAAGRFTRVGDPSEDVLPPRFNARFCVVP